MYSVLPWHPDLHAENILFCEICEICEVKGAEFLWCSTVDKMGATMA